MKKTFKYKAFISYSRAADSKLAPQLKSTLQKFAKPWYKLRVIQVFCDQTNLTANPNLWGAIEKNLSESEYFIYLASPKAAQSKWVKKEIQRFHSEGRGDKIIIVLTDGVLVWNDETSGFDWSRTDALPNLDDVTFKQEPTWLDLTWVRKEQLSVGDPKFLDAIANLSATLRNIDKDILIGKDVEEHRKAKRFRVLSVSGLVFLAIFLLAATFFAIRSENKSQERLVRTFIGNGITSLENKDHIMAFPWFVQAMINERNSNRKELSRLRVDNLFTQMPELVQVWKTELPVLKTDFINNTDILIVSGHSVNWWTNEFDCLSPEKADCRAEIKLLNAETGIELYKPIVISDGIRAIELNKEKTLLASLSVQNKFRLWNLKDGKLIWEKTANVPVTKEAFNTEISFNRQSSKILFLYPVESNSRMEIYDISSGIIITTKDFSNYNTYSSQFLGNGDSIIFNSDGLKIWDIKRNKIVIKETPYLEGGVNFKLSPDEKHMAITGEKSIENFRGFGSSVRSFIAYASIDSIQKPIFVREVNFSVFKIGFDQQGKALATNGSTTTEGGSFDEGTRVWDVLNGNPLTTLISLSEEVDFSFDPTANKIILSCRDGTTEIWEVGEGGSFSGISNRFWKLHDGNHEVKSIFSPDGRYILTSGQMLKLWKAPDETAIQINIDSQGFTDESVDTTIRWYVRYNESDNDTIAPNPTEVYIHEMGPGIKVDTLKHDREVYRALLSWNGDRIATTTDNGTYIWQRDRRRQLCKIPFQSAAGVQSMSFSPDNKKIVIAYLNNLIRVWNAKTGEPISPYMKHPYASDGMLMVLFSKDGKKILSNGGIGKMIWDATTGDPLSASVTNRFAPDDSVVKARKASLHVSISSISPEDLKNYSELISNQQMDAGGSFVPISNQEYLDKWKKWKLVSKR